VDNALTLFIGSPSDVPEERKVVLEVTQDLDARIARPLDLSLRALGFEHVLPGLGRPQDRINREVDTCDVFVGIANVRWGTPTGKHSSGFEEELERIKARHERGEPVAVLLYLHQLEDESQAEPAMQAFREQIRTEALIRWFTDTANFRTQLQADLAQVIAERTGEILRAARAEATEADARALPEGTPHGELPAGGDAGSQEGAAAQARDALARFAAGDDDDAALVRAHVAVAARMSWRLTSATLDVHDVNRLYQYRDQVDLTAEEQSLVVRTAAAHGVVAPVWGLLNYSDEQALTWLMQVLLDDREAHIRAGAATELGPAGINELVNNVVGRGVSAEIAFQRLLSDDTPAVRHVVIEAVASSGRAEAEAILRELLDDAESVLVFERLGMLMVERDMNAALEHAATTPAWVKQDFFDALRARANDLPRDRLVAMLEGNTSTKVLALQLLAVRSNDHPDLQALLEDDSVNVRRAAVAALTNWGVVLDPEQVDRALRDDSTTAAFRALTHEGPTDDELRRRQFASRSPDERARHLNWTELRGGDALAAAVVARDDGAADLARRSLGNELGRVREQHVEAALAQRHDFPVRELAKHYKTLMDNLWIQGALAGLADADANEPGDADLAIRHLDIAARRDAAARLLARTGTTEHLTALVAAAIGTYREEFQRPLLERAVEQAGPERVLQEVVAAEAGDRVLRTLLTAAAENGYDILPEALLPHLVNKDSGVRRAALRVMTQGLDRNSLASLLGELANTSPRYYDVVGILDRMVHGPSFARTRARTALEA
jgi:hypothetical protein